MATPPPPQLTAYDDGPDGTGIRTDRETRRGRWKLAVAALPLLVAVAVFLVNVLGGGTEGGGDDGDAVDRGVAVDAAVPEIPASTATAEVAEPATSVPVPPDGHRAVAIRFAAPDAVDLVTGGDRIDVVGLDGAVLAAGLEVLQDRSTGQARVLVVAVPAEQASELAAVAAARDLTLLLAHTAG